MGCTASNEKDKANSRSHTTRTTTFSSHGIGVPNTISTNGTSLFPSLLTPEQQELIHGTWAFLETDMSDIGKQIFLCIFAKNPTVKQLFPFRDSWGDDLILHPQFVAHTLRFMAVIRNTVRAMDTMEESFGPVLINLGAGHTRNTNFTPDLFILFQTSMLEIMERQLKWKMTAETREAWEILLGFIVRKLQQGYYGQAGVEEFYKKPDKQSPTPGMTPASI